MLDGWLNAIVCCLECGHAWSEMLPPTDGDPVCMCAFCGEMCSVEIAFVGGGR